MRLLIVDDEPLARQRLRALLDEIGDIAVAGEAANGEEAIEQTARLRPDVVLLDIRMPGVDGIQAALQLSRQEPPPAIIFTTAYDEYALSAFDAHAVGYLLKPVRKEKLAEALKAASRFTRAQLQTLETMQAEIETPVQSPTHITARVHGNLRKIPLDSIRYFLAEHKYVTVRHLDGEVLIEEPLISLEQRFGDQFVRIHRNALVARQHIIGLDKDRQGVLRVKLEGIDEGLEVSRRHASDVRKMVRGAN